MNNGWIRLHRKVIESAVWQDPGLLHLWIYCLLKANHKAGWVKIPGLAEPIEVLPGQFITGRFRLQEALYPKKRKSTPSAKTVWRWLSVLETMQNVSIKTSNKYSLLTICNWEAYQSGENESVQVNVPKVSSKCPASVQQVSTNKNEKKVNKEKKKAEPDGFADFWDMYPKKVAKGVARTCWVAALKQTDLTTIMEALTAQLPGMMATEAQFRTRPSVWLKEERWTDEADPAAADAYFTQPFHPRDLTPEEIAIEDAAFLALPAAEREAILAVHEERRVRQAKDRAERAEA